MSIRKKAAAIAAAAALSTSLVLTTPQAALASDPVNMNLVCQQNYGNTSWGAKLVNSSSAYGWKCWNRAYPEQYFLGPFFDADVAYFCMVVYGRQPYSNAAYPTNTSDPYSWVCR